MQGEWQPNDVPPDVVLSVICVGKITEFCDSSEMKRSCSRVKDTETSDLTGTVGDRNITLKQIKSYRLVDQIGHILRRASQRHSTIFAMSMVEGLTPTQFAALAMLFERESVSQNELGRLAAMDVATINGVVDRLLKRKFISRRPDPDDGRRKLLSLTETGLSVVEQAIPKGLQISQTTLMPLSAKEKRTLIELLLKIS